MSAPPYHEIPYFICADCGGHVKEGETHIVTSTNHIVTCRTETAQPQPEDAQQAAEEQVSKGENMNDLSTIRVWCIGSDETEFYAARNEQEMRAWYEKSVGAEQAKEDFAAAFYEVDPTKEITIDGGTKRLTFQAIAELCEPLPNQILTGYN